MALVDPFATLGIEPRFDLDLGAVEKRHRELSRALHPDRYASSGPSERREALNRAVEVNEAFRAVRDPIRRAEALFARAGINVGDGQEPKAGPTFLMEMLEQREDLAAAKAKRDRAAVSALAGAIEARQAKVEASLAAGFAGPAEPNERNEGVNALVPALGELRFYRRFLEEVAAIVEALDDSSAP